MTAKTSAEIHNAHDLDVFIRQLSLDQIQGRNHSRLKGGIEKLVDAILRFVPPGMASITRLFFELDRQNKLSFNNMASSFFACFYTCLGIGLPLLVWSQATDTPMPWAPVFVAALVTAIVMIIWCTSSRRVRKKELQEFEDLIKAHEYWAPHVAIWVARRGGLRISDQQFLAKVFANTYLIRQDMQRDLSHYGVAQAPPVRKNSLWKRMIDSWMASYRAEKTEQENIARVLMQGALGAHIEREQLNDDTSTVNKAQGSRPRL